MKTEKLTLDICFKYPNARIQEYEREMPFKKSSDYENIKDFIEFKVINYGCLGHSMIGRCKLILRPLSSLTDEEKKEIDMIQRKSSLRALADDNDETYRKHFQRITDKYREWNIDVETPSLQERGLCIYE